MQLLATNGSNRILSFSTADNHQCTPSRCAKMAATARVQNYAIKIVYVRSFVCVHVFFEFAAAAAKWTHLCLRSENISTFFFLCFVRIIAQLQLTKFAFEWKTKRSTKQSIRSNRTSNHSTYLHLARDARPNGIAHVRHDSLNRQLVLIPSMHYAY